MLYSTFKIDSRQGKRRKQFTLNFPVKIERADGGLPLLGKQNNRLLSEFVEMIYNAQILRSR